MASGRWLVASEDLIWTPSASPRLYGSKPSPRGGFTLIEMLVAVGLTLLLMTMVVTVMSQVMENISGSRATIEMTDRLRYARERVQKDLAGVTVFPNPPIRPESGQGYLEIIEGSMGVQPSPGSVAFNTDETGTTSPPGMDFMLKVNTGNFPADTTVGDLDDIVMFTARS